MDKQPITLRLDDDVCSRLDCTGSRYGMTKNTLIAAVAYELSRVPADQLWHRLARLTAEEGPAPRQRVTVATQPLDAIEVPNTR